MFAFDPPDEELLEAITRQGLLTPSQRRRVQAALDRGRSLQDVLSSMPLIDPLEWVRVRNSVARPPAPVDGYYPKFAEGEGDEAGLVSARIEMDPALLEGPPAFEVLSCGIAPPPPLAPHELKVPDPEPLAGLPEAVRVLWASTGMPRVDLDEDEGIPFLREANLPLILLLETSSLALQIWTRSVKGGVLRRFGDDGRMAFEETIVGDRPARIAQRYTVMARVPTWRPMGERFGGFEAFRGERRWLVAATHERHADGLECLTVFGAPAAAARSPRAANR